MFSSFFEVLIRNELWGYTLFGDKPVTIAAYRTTPQSIRALSCMDDFFLIKGEEIWKKNSSAFVMKNYIIKFEKDPQGNWGEILLINKRAFLQVCERNLVLFKQVLGDSITAAELLKMVADTNSTFHEVIQHNQALLGIFLGYGTHNSLFFQRREKIIKTIQNVCNLPFFIPQGFDRLSKEDLLLLHRYGGGAKSNHGAIENVSSASIKVAVDEYESIQKIVNQSYAEKKLRHDELAFVSLPSFVMDTACEETKSILEEYKRVRQEIVQAYTKGNFFEVTICKLCEE